MRPQPNILSALALALLVACESPGRGGSSTDAGPRDSGLPDVVAADTAEPDVAPNDADPTQPDAAPDVGLDAAPDVGLDAAGPDGGCEGGGCLVETNRVGAWSRAALLPFLAPGVDIDNGYEVWTLRFTTGGTEALATVTLPDSDTPPGGWHVVANAHGTTGVDDPCALTGTVAGTGLAGLFGARGLIGIAPDYPGLGTEGLHPYLVSEVEAAAVLDSLRAATALAAELDLPVSGRHAVVGLSQGGHAVLATAAAHRRLAPELDIRAFAATAPASVWEEQWRAGVGFDGPHLTFHALLVGAWADHYGWAGPALWSDDLAPRIDDLLASRCIVPFREGDPTLTDGIGSRAAEIFSAPFLDAYRSGEWGDYEAFSGWFAANRIGPYEQTAPLRIYQGAADATVPLAGTRQLVDALRAGGVEVELEVVPGGHHGDVAFGFVAYPELRTEESIAWVRDHLDAEAGR